MNDLLIGTGFYSDKSSHPANLYQLGLWLENTIPITPNIVVVDNSVVGIDSDCLRIIRNNKNLGHVGDPSAPKGAHNRLQGWSMSWIQPALVAYAEGCDYIYKEQDCFAFGDWLPLMKNASITFGRNSRLDCEQSLFWIRHDRILDFVGNYILMGERDCDRLPENKFMHLRAIGDVEFHSLPGGRDRPLPDLDKPFYLQKITSYEMLLLESKKLLWTK